MKEEKEEMTTMRMYCKKSIEDRVDAQREKNIKYSGSQSRALAVMVEAQLEIEEANERN